MRVDVICIKAICILLVVFEHIYCPKFISPIIDIISLVPLAISSGIVFKYEEYMKYGFLEFFIKKLKSVFLIYLAFLIPGIILYIYKMKHPIDIFLIVKNILLIEDISYNEPLWYLGCFFYANISVYLLIKIIGIIVNQKYLKIIICIFLSKMLIYILQNVSIINSPFRFKSMSIITTFMLIGICLKPIIDKLISILKKESISIYFIIVGVIFFLINLYLIYLNTYYTNTFMSMYLFSIGNPVLYFFTGSVFTIYIYISKLKLNYIIDFGKKSLYIYGLHYYFLILVNKILELVEISYDSYLGISIKYIILPLILYYFVKMMCVVRLRFINNYNRIIKNGYITKIKN